MMKGLRVPGFVVIPVLLVAGCLVVSPGVKATDEATVASPEVSKLLASTETEALELKHDAIQMEAFTRSRLSWESHAHQITLIKEHVNKAGELLAELHANRESGAPWQKHAIDEITPLLQELAANTQAAIEHINKSPRRLHDVVYRDYAVANYHTAEKLTALIGDYVDYGETRAKLDELSQSVKTLQD